MTKHILELHIHQQKSDAMCNGFHLCRRRYHITVSSGWALVTISIQHIKWTGQLVHTECWNKKQNKKQFRKFIPPGLGPQIGSNFRKWDCTFPGETVWQRRQLSQRTTQRFGTCGCAVKCVTVASLPGGLNEVASALINNLIRFWQIHFIAFWLGSFREDFTLNWCVCGWIFKQID